MAISMSAEFLELLETLEPKVRKAFVGLLKELEKSRNGQVRREDLSAIEKNIEKLTSSINLLTQAQIKTEERLQRLETTMQQLIEAQKGMEERIQKLETAVEQLIESQKGMEERMKRLEEAQIKTEERLQRLEKVVGGILKEQKRMRQEIGGLAHTIGYRLEDQAIKSLPKLLDRDFNLKIEKPLRRGWIEGIELNIYGEAIKGEKSYFILGEAKSQLKKRDIDSFLKTCKKIKFHYSDKEFFKILITYQTSPKVEEYAKANGIKIYYSFELE